MAALGVAQSRARCGWNPIREFLFVRWFPWGPTVPFWAIRLAFSYPTPSPPSFFQTMLNQQLREFYWQNSSQNLHNKDFKSQNLENMGLTADFRLRAPLACDGGAYGPCWDNDETKIGMTARLDVTRWLWTAVEKGVRWDYRFRAFGLKRSHLSKTAKGAAASVAVVQAEKPKVGQPPLGK